MLYTVLPMFILLFAERGFVDVFDVNVPVRRGEQAFGGVSGSFGIFAFLHAVGRRRTWANVALVPLVFVPLRAVGLWRACLPLRTSHGDDDIRGKLSAVGVTAIAYFVRQDGGTAGFDFLSYATAAFIVCNWRRPN